MTLMLDEWIQKLSEARGRRALAEVLVSMPVWKIAAYHEAIIQRLNVRGFSDGVGYVRAIRQSLIDPRPWSPSVYEALGATAKVIDAILDEPEDEATLDEASRAAIEAELSRIGL